MGSSSGALFRSGAGKHMGKADIFPGSLMPLRPEFLKPFLSQVLAHLR